MTTLVPGSWYNVWVLVNNDSETYEVWLNSTPGGDATAGDQLSNSEAEDLFGFRTTPGADLKNFFIKTGGGNSPTNGRFYIDDIYLESNGSTNLSNPTDESESVSKDDIAVDFGAGAGFWAWMNAANWLKLHPTLSPDLVALANMDGNGDDEVIGDFSSSIGGIYVKYNLASWVKLHSGSSESLTAGDLDGNSQDDVLIDFGAAAGFWARMNDATWLKLHRTLSPDVVATGDLDGNGADDVLAGFRGTLGGLWSKLNLGGWTQEHPNSPDDLVAADVTGNGEDDVVADFATTVGGLWVKRDQGAWQKLHAASSESLTAGELD